MIDLRMGRSEDTADPSGGNVETSFIGKTRSRSGVRSSCLSGRHQRTGKPPVRQAFPSATRPATTGRHHVTGNVPARTVSGKGR
jgi:hypothetical protein